MKADRFLDIGRGDGEITTAIAKFVKCNDVYGVDISPEAVKSLKKGIKAYQVDVEESNLPFDSSYFDFIYCREFSEHLFNHDQTLREINRVLKAHAHAIITTPNLTSWYNRALIVFGYQPFHYSASLENFDAVCFPLLRKGSVSGRAHIRTMTYKAFRELLKRHCFKIILMKGGGTATGMGIIDRLNKFVSTVPSLASYLIALVEKLDKI